jgi:hypothetical protein
VLKKKIEEKIRKRKKIKDSGFVDNGGGGMDMSRIFTESSR